MNVPEVTLLLGLTKCDVFARLKNSPRNCSRTRSPAENSRVISRSVFQVPGPRRIFLPLFPKVAMAVTGAKAAGS